MQKNQTQKIFIVGGKPVSIAYENGRVDEVAYSGMRAKRSDKGEFKYQ